MKNILIVEDDPDHSKLICEALEAGGFLTRAVKGANAALEEIKVSRPDLIVLDQGLPGISGIEFLDLVKRERETAFLPIIMLTASSRKKDKLRGLGTGADDYVTKPFDSDELLARVLALLRRVDHGGETNRFLTLDNISIDRDRQAVSVNGKKLDLRRKEFDLLVLMVNKPGRVFSHKLFQDKVWGKDMVVTSHTLRCHIRNLRTKLGPAGKKIKTIHGVGYKIRRE